jgi:hypothetical protein
MFQKRKGKPKIWSKKGERKKETTEQSNQVSQSYESNRHTTGQNLNGDIICFY